MQVKSLVKLSTEACIANLRSIDDVGEAPYHLVKPFLLKIDNPQQLEEIEQASPQIAGADAEIWQAFIKRDIRNWKEKWLEPKNPHKWARVYRRLRKEADEDTRRQEETLKAALNQQTEEKQSNQMRYIDQVIDPRKKSTKPAWSASRAPNASVLSFAGGSRTKVSTGRGLLDRAKREAREASLFSARRSVLSTPTHRLAETATHGRIVGPNRTGPDAVSTSTPQDRMRPASMAGSRASSAVPSNMAGSRASSAVPASIASSRASSAAPSSIGRPAMSAANSSGRLASSPEPRPSPLKRPAVSVFMSPKKRRV